MAHSSAALRVLLEALERRRCLFWTGNVLVELDRDFDPSEDGVGGVTMVLDDEDFAALKALSSSAPGDLREKAIRAVRDKLHGAEPPEVKIREAELLVDAVLGVLPSPSSAPERPEHIRSIIAAQKPAHEMVEGSAPEPDRQAEMLPSATLCVQYGEQQPGSSDPMPEEKRAEYQARIASASKRTRIDPSLQVGSSAPEQMERGAEALFEFDRVADLRRGSYPEAGNNVKARYRRQSSAVLDAVFGPPDERLRELATAVHRLNVDWTHLRTDCGDMKCLGDCRYVQNIDRILNEVLGIERSEAPSGPPESDERRILGALNAPFATSDGSDDPLRASAQGALNAWLSTKEEQ